MWSPTITDFFSDAWEGIFQSTGSVWSPTLVAGVNWSLLGNFNPRAPCGARRGVALVGGICMKFQSTGSVWSPTGDGRIHAERDHISIHGLRVEPDAGKVSTLQPSTDFNPRAPCGARRRERIIIIMPAHFNPRAPCGARRRTSSDSR